MKTLKKLSVWVVVMALIGSFAGMAYGADPLKITFMAPFYQAQPPSMDNGVIAKIEDLTNTKLDATWIPDPNFLDKFSLMVAGGNLPMVIRLNGRTWQSGVFINACRAGLFWELSPELLQNFPNLAALIPQEAITDAMIDGKLYTIPMGTDTARIGLMYRKDWLTKLGLAVPETVADIVNVAKAFTEQDPDGNGQADTVGFGWIDDAENEQAFAGFDWFHVSMGGANKWSVVDGQMIPYWDTPEYIETMKVFKSMYDNGWMNQDFALLKGNAKYQAINQGKVGMMVTTATNLETKYKDLQKLMGIADEDWLDIMDVQTQLKTADSQIRLSAISAVKDGFVFTKKAIKTEDDLKLILAYFDAAADEKGAVRRVLENGLEGVHYDSLDANGRAVRNEDQSKLYRDEVNELVYLRFAPIRYSDWEIERANRPIFLYTTKLIMANEQYAVKDPSVLYMPLSETFTMKGKDIEKIVSDARVKFIMGQLDEAGFKAEVERWKKQGGQKIMDELSREYAKAVK